MARKRGEVRKLTGGRSNCGRPLPVWKTALEHMLEVMIHLKIGKMVDDFEAEWHPCEPPEQIVRRGAFPFLRLPRELRDQTYGYILETPLRDYLYPEPDSILVQAQYHTKFRLKLYVPSTPRGHAAILCASRQVYREALQVLYATNEFTIHLDKASPIFKVRRARGIYDERHAIPFGWDVSLITRLYLRIDLGSCAISATMKAFEWPDLSFMVSLKYLQLLLTSWEVHMGDEPVFNHTDSRFSAIHFIRNKERDKNGTEVYRAMMSQLFDAMPASVRHIGLGVGDKEVWRGWRNSVQIEGMFLRKSLEDLESFRAWQERVTREIQENGEMDLKIIVDAVR